MDGKDNTKKTSKCFNDYLFPERNTVQLKHYTHPMHPDKINLKMD